MAIAASITKHVVDQVRIRLISQLINCISRVFQNLLKYFNGTLVLTFLALLFPVPPAIFVLKLNDALLLLSVGKSTLSKYGLSLYYCHKLPDVFEYLSLYFIKLYIGISMSMSLALSICALFISLMQLVY